ncbi:hypothetical protein [Elioraea rosea]|uniref:hypothetical protein n=1 Tax=Elioraea rosea TaxID=2492390 RepID=UPI00118278C1|nr:hypothetical protein [Elioraea rosea]
MTERVPVLFCDGIIEANVLNGVVRITLGQAGGDGKPSPCGQIVLPLTQLPGATNAMVALVRQIQDKMKESAPKQQGAAPAEAPAAPSDMPSAFKFS